MKKKNRTLFVVQKFIDNNWCPFNTYSTYITVELAKTIMDNIREHNPLTRYRIAVMLNGEMINTIY